MNSFLVLVLVTLTSSKVVVSFETCSWAFKGNPLDCNSYYQCNFGQSILQKCPEGLHWNSNANTCDWARNAGCDTAEVDEIQDNSLEEDRELDVECTDSATGFLPHPDDCGKYLVCNHGSLLEMSCTPPLEWNAIHNTCDWPGNSGCQSNKPSTTTTQAPTPPIPGPSIEGPSITGTAVGPPAPPEETTDEVPTTEETISITDSTTPTPSNTTENTTDTSPTTTLMPTTTSMSTTTSVKPTPPSTSTTRPRPPPTSTFKPSGSTIVGIIIGPDLEESSTVVGPPAPPPTSFDLDFPEVSDQDHKVICYFTGWAWYRPEDGKFKPSDVDPRLCTHIVYAFAVLDSNTWTIQSADTWTDLDNHFYEQVTSFKKNGRKVTIAIGGWNDSGNQKYSLLLRDPSKLSKFIASVVVFVKKYNFDGVDLDYEYPGCPNGECKPDFASDKSGFIALVRGLREALPSGAILSAAVSCSKPIIDKGYDVPTLSKYLDWIGVMTYDIHGSWDKETGHIAPLYHYPTDRKEFLNVDYAIKYWISKGALASKLILGIPLYGQSFSLLNATNTGIRSSTAGPGQAGKSTRQPGVLAYYEICSNNWSLEVQDSEKRMGPYVVQGNQWVSYDDKPAVIRKTEYIKKMGLGGAMVWSLDFDDWKNRCGKGKYPLLNAITNSLHAANYPLRFD